MDKEKIMEGVKLILEGIGEDPEREAEGYARRIARMYGEICGGMEEDAKDHLSRTFAAENNGIVLEKDIALYSACEHHLMPFYGKAHVAYIPDAGSRLKQAGQDGGSLRQKAPATGADDRQIADAWSGIYTPKASWF